MPWIRQEAILLAKNGKIQIMRKGKVVEGSIFKGIYRLALPQKYP